MKIMTNPKKRTDAELRNFMRDYGDKRMNECTRTEIRNWLEVIEEVGKRKRFNP
jgi:hypothetical protein